MLVVVGCDTPALTLGEHDQPLFGFACAPGEYHSCACPWEDAASTHRTGLRHCTSSFVLGACEECDGGSDAADAD